MLWPKASPLDFVPGPSFSIITKIIKGPGVVVVDFGWSTTLHMPKKLKFQIWLRLSENHQKQAYGMQRSTHKRCNNEKVCGGGVVVCEWMGKPNLETTRRLRVDQKSLKAPEVR